MKTPQQIKNEVKNEVKEQFLKDAGMQIISWEIGESWDRAIDLTLTEYDKSIKEMIEDLKNKLNKREIKVYDVDSALVSLNELLSKIEDNSEVGKC